MTLQLGTNVRVKNTNASCKTGKIVGLMMPQPYLFIRRWESRNKDFRPLRWDQLFPDWEKKLLYYVYLDAPCRNLSLHEYIDQVKDRPEHIGLTEYELEEKYNNIPYIIMTTHPEDDLEELVGLDDLFDMQEEAGKLPANMTKEVLAKAKVSHMACVMAATQYLRNKDENKK